MDYNTNCAVYKITNKVNKKFYIGSSKTLKSRWAAHRWELKYNRHHNAYLQNSYNKYGKEVFEYEVLEWLDNEESLLDREQYYIDSLNACDKSVGYNLNTNSSGGGGAVGERNGWYGKGYLNSGLLNYFIGKTHTEETKKKLSEYATKRIGSLNPNFGNRSEKNPLSKAVLQISKDDLKVAKKWPAIIDSTRELGYHVGNISVICRLVKEENVWKQYKDCYWCYEEDFGKINTKKDFTHSQKIQVVQLDKEGDLISVFQSLKEAADFIGVRSENISRVCKGKMKTSRGYKWMYLEEYEKSKVTQ